MTDLGSDHEVEEGNFDGHLGEVVRVPETCSDEEPEVGRVLNCSVTCTETRLVHF